jgi:hypothetical protein
MHRLARQRRVRPVDDFKRSSHADAFMLAAFSETFVRRFVSDET